LTISPQTTVPPAFSFEKCTAIHIKAAPTATDASCAINLKTYYGIAFHFNPRMNGNPKYVAMNTLVGTI
jgi:hypothetical protein